MKIGLGMEAAIREAARRGRLAPPSSNGGATSVDTLEPPRVGRTVPVSRRCRDGRPVRDGARNRRRSSDGRITNHPIFVASTLSLIFVLFFAAIAPLAAAERPNVVFIVSDDQSWTDFGFMGNERVHTPHLDALATRSARFPNGYAPASVCRPSLVTMLTGLYPHQHGVHFNHGPPGNRGYNAMTSPEEYRRTRCREFELIRRLPTLPGLLRDEAGYRSLQTGKFWEGHWRNGDFTEGMTTFGAPPPDQTYGGVRTLASGERVAHGNGDVGLQIGRETMEPIVNFVNDCEAEDTPWFVWYAPYLPHRPHDAPERFVEMARDRPGVKEHELPYFASIAQFDHTVGELVRLVEEGGLADETLFVFVVDNGWSPSREPHGRGSGDFKHTERSKRAPFDEGLRTPVLLRWDGEIEPASHEGLVSTVDLLPTVLTAVGLGDAVPDDLPGIDLVPVARGEEEIDPDRAVFGAIYPGDATRLGHPDEDVAYRWVRRGEHKLIVPEREDPWRRYLVEPALYDLAADPHEAENLHDVPDLRETCAELRERLEAWWDGEENRVGDW